MNLPFFAPTSKPKLDIEPRNPLPFYPDLDSQDDNDSWDNSSIWQEFYIAPLDTKKYEPEYFCASARDASKTDNRKKAA